MEGSKASVEPLTRLVLLIAIAERAVRRIAYTSSGLRWRSVEQAHFNRGIALRGRRIYSSVKG